MIEVIAVFDMWVIGNTEEPEFVFGPFESEADALFVADMFRKKKIIFNGG